MLPRILLHGLWLKRVTSKTLRICLAALTALAVICISSVQPAQANAPAPSWWHGTTCDTYDYPGSYPLGASYNGVQACGPGPTQGGTDHLVNFYSGAWGEYEWECVELVMRYMYLIYGIAPYSAPGGKDVVANYSGSVLTKVSNSGGSGNIPSPGDILSFAPSANHPTYGHTAVVTGVSVDGSGNGTVTYMQQNASANGWGSVSDNNYLLGDSISGWLHDPNSVTSGSTIMTIDASGAAWANNNLGLNGWTQETNSGTTKAIAVGGNRMMILNTANEAWAQNGITPGFTQVTPTGNTVAIAVGSSGRMMTIDACGASWANDNISMSGWTQETTCGDTQAIAVGGSRMLIINGCGAAYAKDTLTGPFNAISGCGNTKAIAVGSSGRMMLIDASSTAWASDSITSGWTQVSPTGNAKGIAVGGSRLVLLNTANETWANNNISSSGWVQLTPAGNTLAIAAGSNGRTIAIDVSNAAWAEDTMGMSYWTQETPSGNTSKIAVG